MKQQEQISSSGTRVLEHEHPDIHMYKFTEEEIFSVTSIDEERKYENRCSVSIGAGVSCFVSMCVNIYEGKTWIFYALFTIGAFCFTYLTRKDYLATSKKRKDILNKLMNKRRVNSTAKISVKTEKQ